MDKTKKNSAGQQQPVNDKSQYQSTSGGSTAAEQKRASEITGRRSHSVKINLDTEIQRLFDISTPHERQKLAFDYIMKNLRGKYASKDGDIIAIEKIGADKITHTKNEIKIRVTPELANLIKSGTLRSIVDAEHKSFVKFAYYDVEFELGGDKYEGILNVGIRAGGESSLYDLNPFNKK